MKQLLFIAAAAAMVVSANAQGREGKPVSMQQAKPAVSERPFDASRLMKSPVRGAQLSEYIANDFKSMTVTPVNHFAQPSLKASRHSQLNALSADLLDGAQPILTVTDAPANVPNLVDYYTGFGYNIEEMDNTGKPTKYSEASWQMFPVTLQMRDGSEAFGLVDVLPNPWAGTTGNLAKGVPVLAQIVDAHTVNIPAQPIVDLKNDMFVWFCAGATEDGHLTMLIDDNGNITLDNKEEELIYALLSQDDAFSWKDVKGFGEYIMMPEFFALDGAAEDPFTASKVYTGSGLHDGAPASWQMALGTYAAEDGNQYALIKNLIPMDDEPLYVEYSLKGNQIIIEPQYIANVKDNTGKTFYLLIDNYDDEETGRIVLNLNLDGTIQKTNLNIELGVFSSPEFDANSWVATYDVFNRVNYFAEGESAPVEAEYQPNTLTLFSALNMGTYNYVLQQAMAPAYAPYCLKNMNPAAAEKWSWNMPSVENIKQDAAGKLNVELGEAITSSATDFEVSLDPGPYLMPTLTGTTADNSGSYTWGTVDHDYEVVYASHMTSSVLTDEEDGWLWSSADLDRGLTLFSFAATPDKNSNKYSLSDLILYQGKASKQAPLYCEGISMLVYQAAADGLDLTCRIVKAHQDPQSYKLTLGDIIAESTTAQLNTMAGSFGLLSFTDFYQYDEDGMSIGLDYLFIDDEFAVVIEGWNNGSLSANVIGENAGNVHGTPSLYCQESVDGPIMGFYSLYQKPFVCFDGAIYGYLHTEDNTNIVADVNGGEYTFDVDAMLMSVNESGEYTTRLWLDESVCPEQPEWIHDEIVSEAYNAEESKFTLKITVDPLPAGEAGRFAQVVYCQEGARLILNIGQGEFEGIQAVRVDNTNAAAYNLYGMPVEAGYKGIVINKGVKSICK